MTTATTAGTLAAYLDRLVDFAEPAPADDCLDLSYGPGPLAAALQARAGRVTAVDIEAEDLPLAQPSGAFTLVTARFSLNRLTEPAAALREMLRVCAPGGRIVVADLARTNTSSDHRDALERVRDPGYRVTPPIGDLTAMAESAGARVTRLDLMNVTRPADPWIASARDPRIAARLREVLLAEVSGGPKTGARPRLINGELWFTQTWAHLTATPG